MKIKWDALGEVLGIGLAAGVGVVVLFSFALVGFSWVNTARARGANAVSGTVVGGVCVATCLAITAYGLYLIANH